MARILSVPDVHGSHEWEVVKTLPKDSYDFIVFHGDYFDSWENEQPDQGENFKAICDFVREDTEHRKLLIGNHDWSYLSQSREGQNCSGHQSGSIYSEGKITVIRELLLGTKDILELAFECDGWVFSHAGFSKTAVNYMQVILKNLGFIQDGKDYSISLLNSVLKSGWTNTTFQTFQSGFHLMKNLTGTVALAEAEMNHLNSVCGFDLIPFLMMLITINRSWATQSFAFTTKFICSREKIKSSLQIRRIMKFTMFSILKKNMRFSPYQR